MKYLSILLIAFTTIGCKQTKVLTYQEGKDNCKRLLAETKIKSKEDFDAYVNCIVGAQIPDFLATTINGKHITKPQLVGKITIINFWFIGCAPCEAEIPGFNAIVEKYGSDNINYVTIGKDDRHDIKEFLQTHPWNFEHIADGGELIDNNFQINSGFPTTFVLDKNAKIIAVFSGGKTDETAVEEIQRKLNPVIEKELKKRTKNRKIKI